MLATGGRLRGGLYGFQNNCLGILGEDTDYLIYDTCPYFSISELPGQSGHRLCSAGRSSQSLGLRLASLASAGLPAWQ